MASKFQVGQAVTMSAYTDCFGVFHNEVRGLLVTKITRVVSTCGTLAPYYRIMASYPQGSGYHEAAERFFDQERN